MDFELSEEQESIRDLAREILANEIDSDRLKELDASDAWFDAELWAKLGEANLLGLVVPEAHGGMGFGVEELCALLVEVGRALAPVPIHGTAIAALVIAKAGSADQQANWLPGIASGETIVTLALDDAGSVAPEAPATTAKQDGETFLLTGTKRAVPAVHLAKGLIVPARSDGDVALFWVDPNAAGVTRTRRRASTGEPLFEIVLDGAVGERLGQGAELARWLHDLATIGLCALQTGVSERSLEITTGYVKEREQFGGPIGAFQAVQHRCADGYIDLESIRWTMWRAASRLARGLDVGREAAVAKFWAADGGSRVAGSAQHLHGGIGVDVDYPIHRYFLWTKALEFRLGGTTPTLVRLGRDMAAHPPETRA